MFLEQFLSDLKENLSFITRCLFVAVILGGICGVVGAAFCLSVNYVTEFRNDNAWIVYLLPLGGILIVYLYRSVHLACVPGTNTIIKSIRQQDKVPVLLAPAIFLATVITHLVGGSSGREGAALQIGGSLATAFGKMIHADQKQMSILIMCGMSAVFSALFGMPITATLFAMEVVSVGIFYYAAFVPCLCSSLIAAGVARYFGCHPESFKISKLLHINVMSFFKLLFFSFFIALFSIIFIIMMHYGHKLFKKWIENAYLRVCVGSLILLVLVFFFGHDYLGAGMNIVENAMTKNVHYYDFILKAIFTAVTIGCGFKGGEIVPTFFIGATLGYTIGMIIGIDPHIGASLGLVSMFCCVVNCPVTSLALGIEMFGGLNFVPFAIVVAFGYVLSGYFSLYQAQKIVYSKTSPSFINKNAS